MLEEGWVVHVRRMEMERRERDDRNMNRRRRKHRSEWEYGQTGSWDDMVRAIEDVANADPY
jgi:hypothetical protein